MYPCMCIHTCVHMIDVWYELALNRCKRDLTASRPRSSSSSASRCLGISLHLHLYNSIILDIYRERGVHKRFGLDGRRRDPTASRPRCSSVFTRYSFTPKLACTSQSSLYCPLHLHCSHPCSTIARRMHNIRPPPDPPCICHTPYNIGSGNIL